jgi:ribosomal protein L37AE/L43A
VSHATRSVYCPTCYRSVVLLRADGWGLCRQCRNEVNGEKAVPYVPQAS